MGSGVWTSCAYVDHSVTTRGFASMDEFSNASAQELYRSTSLNPMLDPKNVIRECLDSDEHPYTKPVIIGLDVTGSMGSGTEAVAKQLNDIMEQLYGEVDDIEFMTMGIGDLSYDWAPIQATQFESDIRIAEQLEKVYFEKGGGGNKWESYTAAWYFGLHNTKLDCLERGQKALIITIGDEPLNPYLPLNPLRQALGDINDQSDIDTEQLYREATQKFNIYHINFNDYRTSYELYKDVAESKWKAVIGDHYRVATTQTFAKVVSDIIKEHYGNSVSEIKQDENGISW